MRPYVILILTLVLLANYCNADSTTSTTTGINIDHNKRSLRIFRTTENENEEERAFSLGKLSEKVGLGKITEKLRSMKARRSAKKVAEAAKRKRPERVLDDDAVRKAWEYWVMGK
ncbi:Protein that recognizes and binds damaged DNA in an ATP-dependent manner (with Rad7p) [Phytophthora palmivora]|uniref:RxLR effector protein n=1 Tax=Phytophthora palmivora TaxID=4796 RepID=A0A2P4YJ43_9STRA|nr:Protein that recognizes and binds damaged DNA in an ATP-dependent manner (with Rad7p) [Phytophthora palmivora]